MARVAFIVGEMFEDSEFRIPYDRVTGAGHSAVVIGVDREHPIHGERGHEHVTPDKAIDEVSAAEFDALVIPGGYSPDHLRMNRRMVGLTRELFLAGKPVAADCCGVTPYKALVDFALAHVACVNMPAETRPLWKTPTLKRRSAWAPKPESAFCRARASSVIGTGPILWSHSKCAPIDAPRRTSGTPRLLRKSDSPLFRPAS